MQTTARDLSPEVLAYFDTLPRDERLYAASYAHWGLLLSDRDLVVAQASAFGVGIRAGRLTAIRRAVDLAVAQ